MTSRPRLHLAMVGWVAVLAALVGLAVAGAHDRALLDRGAEHAGVASPQARPSVRATPRTATSPTTKPSPTTRATVPPVPVSLNDRDWKMVPMPQLSPYSDAVIKNSSASTRAVRVCRSWSETTCGRSSPRGELKPGEDSQSKFGWGDTDAFDKGHGWVQQHGCFRCVVTVTSK